MLEGQAPPALLAHLRPRARGRGRREHPQLHPLHRLHHAQVQARRAPSATPRCRSRPRCRSPAPWSTRAACRRPRSTTRRSPRRTPSRSAARPASARRCRTRRCGMARAARPGSSNLLGPALHPDLLRRRAALRAARRTCGWCASAMTCIDADGPVPAALRRAARLGLAGAAGPASVPPGSAGSTAHALTAADAARPGLGAGAMSSLITLAQPADPDGFYAAFVDRASGTVRRGQRAAQCPPRPDPGQPYRRPGRPGRGARLAASAPPGNPDDGEPPAAGPEQPKSPARSSCAGRSLGGAAQPQYLLMALRSVGGPS